MMPKPNTPAIPPIVAAQASAPDCGPPGLEARPYQQRIIARTLGLLKASVSSVLIEAPTGSGKTVMALAIAQAMQEQLGMSVGWAAMRRNLLAQAAVENARNFGVEMKLISMFDKCPPQVDLLVVDEAQHDGALSMATLHGIIKPKKVMGLTATPFRSDRIKLCFQEVIRDAGIHRLIQDGFLSQFIHYTIPSYTPGSVAAAYAREPDRWGQSLIFFHRLADCVACQQQLEAQGVQTEVVTATTDRERQIDDFAAGRIRVLLSMLVLAEGFDCPSLHTVFCRPGSKLPTIQMCGRVLRKHPGLPFKQIVQCERTSYPFTRTATPAEQYLWTAEGWRSLTVNRRIDAMSHRMLQVIASVPVSMPEFLAGWKPGPGPRRRYSTLSMPRPTPRTNPF